MNDFSKKSVAHALSGGNYEHPIQQGHNRPMTFQVGYSDVSGTVELKAYLSADKDGPWVEVADATKTLAAGDGAEYLQLSDMGFAFIKFAVEGANGTVDTAQLLY